MPLGGLIPYDENPLVHRSGTMMGMGGMPSYGGIGGFGLMDPAVMQALATNPQFGTILDAANVPAPQGPMAPQAQLGLGDILSGVLGTGGVPGGGVGGGGNAQMGQAPAPQVAKPQGQDPVRLVGQNAPAQGKAPGNPLMDLMLATLLGGSRPGLGR